MVDDADRRHVGRALHDAGRRGPQHLAHGQLPPAGERHGRAARRSSSWESAMSGLSRTRTKRGTVFRDVIMLALAGFVAMVILLLPHLNPPARPPRRTPAARQRDRRGALARRDRLRRRPVGRGAGRRPVGYSNKGGVIFNLLRDDLGKRADATGMNYEVSYSRGIPAGEYTVNVHLYRNTSAPCRSRSPWSPASRSRRRNPPASCWPARSS